MYIITYVLLNLWSITNYVLFSVQLWLKHFKFQWQWTQWTLSLYSNLNSCPQRLCEGIGQILRKDDSFKSTSVIYSTVLYMNYSSMLSCLPSVLSPSCPIPLMSIPSPLSPLPTHNFPLPTPYSPLTSPFPPLPALFPTSSFTLPTHSL